MSGPPAYDSSSCPLALLLSHLGYVTTEPTGTSETTAYSDSFEKTMRAFKTVLEQNRDAIQLTEVIFGINAVGFYDLDGNGLPELYFISDDGNEYSASLHVYEYNEYAGEAIEVVTSPEIITQGQASNYHRIL